MTNKTAGVTKSKASGRQSVTDQHRARRLRLALDATLRAVKPEKVHVDNGSFSDPYMAPTSSQHCRGPLRATQQLSSISQQFPSQRKLAEIIDLTGSDNESSTSKVLSAVLGDPTHDFASYSEHPTPLLYSSPELYQLPFQRYKQESISGIATRDSELARYGESPESGKQCSCGKPAGSIDASVRCAGSDCKYGVFHRSCVGLSSRKDTTGWRCYACRPRIVLSNLPPTMVCPPPADTSRLPASTTNSAEPEPPLHEEQEKVVRAITIAGRNVFYTGSAGVGKSTVLKAFVKELKQRGKHVDIIAPSGIAALNVGGKTIHGESLAYLLASSRPRCLHIQPMQGGMSMLSRRD